MASLFNSFLYVSSVLILTEILFNIRKYLNQKTSKTNVKPKKVKRRDVKTEIGLFFPDYSLSCPFVYRNDYYSKPISFNAPELKCKKPFCKFRHFSTDPKTDSPLRRMIRTLNSAKKSLEVCLWIFSFPILANVCIELHKNNVRVRIVIDSREDETSNTQICRLISEGIEVRFGPQMVNYGMFHHKFAIIDDHILMTGSMNWTRSAIWKSYENICITSKQELVECYVNKFNQYWNTFSSIPTNIKKPLIQ